MTRELGLRLAAAEAKATTALSEAKGTAAVWEERLEGCGSRIGE
jgi:hypothetical protein